MFGNPNLRYRLRGLLFSGKGALRTFECIFGACENQLAKFGKAWTIDLLIFKHKPYDLNYVFTVPLSQFP
jgi:hypothetical protein